MSSVTPIDLSQLPAPTSIEVLSYEDVLSAMKTDLAARDASLIPALESEAEPINKLLQVCALRETLLRERINDAVKATMLAYANAADLDNIAAMFGVSRQIIDAGDAEVNPPIPPTYETDDRLRQRVQLSLEGFSTAGPRGAYVYHGLSADPRVKDIAVTSPSPGNVTVTVLSTQGDGTASEAVLGAVRRAVNDDNVRPLTDNVTVASAEIVTFRVKATFTFLVGPDTAVVRKAARDAVWRYINEHHRLGHTISRSGLLAALHQPGVETVNLTSPTTDLSTQPHQAPRCNYLDLGGESEQ